MSAWNCRNSSIGSEWIRLITPSPIFCPFPPIFRYSPNRYIPRLPEKESFFGLNFTSHTKSFRKLLSVRGSIYPRHGMIVNQIFDLGYPAFFG